VLPLPLLQVEAHLQGQEVEEKGKEEQENGKEKQVKQEMRKDLEKQQE
jgi:hypothetical protein